MKKLIAFILTLVMVLSLAACGGSAGEQIEGMDSQQQEHPADGEEDVPEVPDEFAVAAGDDLIYQELVFEDDITIHLDPEATAEQRSQILFAGCTFNGNIRVIGERSAFLRFVEGCVFGEDCEIAVVESADGAADGITIEDDLVKLIFTDPGAVVKAESVCNVICFNGEGLVVDGVEYLKADFPDNDGFCVATYFENGEKQVFTLGVDDE